MNSTISHSASSKIFRGAAWFITGSIFRVVIGFLLNILLARQLPPEMFGLGVVLITILSLMQIFSEVGLSVALVQKENLTAAIRDNVVYLSVFFAITASITYALFQESIAILLNQPQLVEYTIYIIPLLFIRTMTSIYRSLLLRDYSYKRISLTEACAHVIHGTTVLVLVLLNFGVVSLVWGHILSACFLLLAYFRVVRVFPRERFSLSTCKDLLNFGAWVALNRVMGHAAGDADRFVISAVISPVAMAGYYIANTLATIAPNLVTGALDQASLPVYARTQSDLEMLESQYWSTVRMAAIVTFPIILIPASHANVLIEVLYGSAWQFSAEIFQILSMFSLIGALGGGLFASIMYATARTKELALVGMFRIIALPLCVYVGSAYGITGVAWGVVVFAALGRLMNQAILRYSLGFEFMRMFQESYKFLVVGILIAATGWNRADGLFDVILISAMQCGFWIIGMYLLCRSDLTQFSEKLRALSSH